jgi:farnesyl-diphosphate farnesyltransferase
LPAQLRKQVAIAYLLARASDTIADTVGPSVEVKLAQLKKFRAMLESNGDPSALQTLLHEINPRHEGERELLRKLPDVSKSFHRLSAGDQRQIRLVLQKITRGQELDVQRFVTAPALQTAQELDEYIYLVAGCVGEFWTQLCSDHLHRFARSDLATMQRLGVNFGKGLQLVNILRDTPVDLQAGRCYLPLEELQTIGIELRDLEERPERARPVFERWHQIAREYLDDAFDYISALTNYRVRIACILPWYLGVRTLLLMQRFPPLETPERVKVPRKEVKRAILWTPIVALSNRALSALRRRAASGTIHFSRK